MLRTREGRRRGGGGGGGIVGGRGCDKLSVHKKGEL